MFFSGSDLAGTRGDGVSSGGRSTREPPPERRTSIWEPVALAAPVSVPGPVLAGRSPSDARRAACACAGIVSAAVRQNYGTYDTDESIERSAGAQLSTNMIGSRHGSVMERRGRSKGGQGIRTSSSTLNSFAWASFASLGRRDALGDRVGGDTLPLSDEASFSLETSGSSSGTTLQR